MGIDAFLHSIIETNASVIITSAEQVLKLQVILLIFYDFIIFLISKQNTHFKSILEKIPHKVTIIVINSNAHKLDASVFGQKNDRIRIHSIDEIENIGKSKILE